MNTADVPGDKKHKPKVIKKYGNRKLYDTELSSYIVLKDIEKMIRKGLEIQIIDNETNEDITIATLTQIIFSSERKSKLNPPVNILRSIIREGDGSLSSFLAKLGLFSITGGKRRNFNARGEKEQVLTAEMLNQNIARWLSSGDESRVNRVEDSIPELPGSHNNL